MNMEAARRQMRKQTLKPKPLFRGNIPHQRRAGRNISSAHVPKKQRSVTMMNAQPAEA